MDIWTKRWVPWESQPPVLGRTGFGVLISTKYSTQPLLGLRFPWERLNEPCTSLLDRSKDQCSLNPSCACSFCQEFARSWFNMWLKKERHRTMWVWSYCIWCRRARSPRCDRGRLEKWLRWLRLIDCIQIGGLFGKAFGAESNQQFSVDRVLRHRRTTMHASLQGDGSWKVAWLDIFWDVKSIVSFTY